MEVCPCNPSYLGCWRRRTMTSSPAWATHWELISKQKWWWTERQFIGIAWYMQNSGCHTQEPRQSRESRFLCSLSTVVNMVLSRMRWSPVFCVWRKHHGGALQHQGRGSCFCTYDLCGRSSSKQHLTLRRQITVTGLADHWEEHRCEELSSSLTEQCLNHTGKWLFQEGIEGYHPGSVKSGDIGRVFHQR